MDKKKSKKGELQVIGTGAAGLAEVAHTIAHSIRREVGVTHDRLGVYALDNRNYDGRAELYAEIDDEMRERGCGLVDTATYPDDPNVGNTLVMVWASASDGRVEDDLEALREAFRERGKLVGMTFG